MSKIKREIKQISIFLPAILAVSCLIVLADKTGKLGVLGTLITLLINPDNYELRYNKKIRPALKLKIIYIKEFLLCFFCSCYITYIVNKSLSSPVLIRWSTIILPTIFFISIWLYVRVLIPKIISYFNNKGSDS